MSRVIEEILGILHDEGIEPRIVHHPPIHTIEALNDYDIEGKNLVAKNLFLRNDNGKAHYLITIRQDKMVDLRAIRDQIGCSRLSFASQERLKKHLNLEPGSVTPLGMLQKQGNVTFYLDGDLASEEKIGVHPGDNRATIWISYQDLCRVFKARNIEITLIKV